MIATIAGKNDQQSLQLCGNHFLAIVMITAIIWKPAYMETAQRSKSPRPLNVSGGDRSDHMKTNFSDAAHIYRVRLQLSEYGWLRRRFLFARMIRNRFLSSIENDCTRALRWLWPRSQLNKTNRKRVES